MITLDERWLAAHPLPGIEPGTNKNDRGRVFIVGGSTFVPGALRLTGEASLRAGAGKLQFGTVREAAILLGMFVPEAGVLGLPASADGDLEATGGDLVVEHAGSCEALVLGPGMRGSGACAELVRRILTGLPKTVAIVVDAAAIAACADCRELVRSRAGPVILTPHRGEMAALSGLELDEVKESAAAVARQMADDLDAIIVLKDAETIIASPAADCLKFDGGTPALATGGSGDVLAGIVGGLLARGTDPLSAAAWSVWVHGAAGTALTEANAGAGLLSRELTARLPRLLNIRFDHQA